MFFLVNSKNQIRQISGFTVTHGQRFYWENPSPQDINDFNQKAMVVNEDDLHIYKCISDNANLHSLSGIAIISKEDEMTEARRNIERAKNTVDWV